MPRIKPKPKVVVRDATPFEREALALVDLIREMLNDEELNNERDYWADELDSACSEVEWQFKLQQINAPAVRLD